MSPAADTSLGGPVVAAEMIGLFSDPCALFDADAALLTCNAAFETHFSAVSGFLRPGTSWDIFLAEVERSGTLPPTVCRDLRMVEERMLDRPGQTQTLDAALPDGAAEIALTMVTGGGFALRIAPSGPSGSQARGVEQVMSTVLEACPTSLTMARIGDGQILYRSPAATELLGKGRKSHDHFVNREDRADFVTALLPEARVDDMRITGRRGDGTEFPASISARLIEYGGEDVVVYSILDLTDQISLQGQLARQKDLTFRAEKMSALGELLAGVAHELNNPLSIVVGNALILKEEELQPGILRRVDRVSEAAERCVRIVRTFLSMARERPLELLALAPSVIAEAAMDSFLAGAEGLTVEFEADVPEDLPDILIDDTQIVQVLTNLFHNASQAMAEAGIGDTISVSAALAEDGRFVRFVVADNGPGVPADIAERIFDPLFTTKAAGKGTGVGLALCNRIVSSHGGAIALDTTPGQGAAFSIDLPIAQGDPE